MCDIHAMNAQQADTKCRQRSKEFPTKTQANKAKPTGYRFMYNMNPQATLRVAKTVRRKRNGIWVCEKPKPIKSGKAEQKSTYCGAPSCNGCDGFACRPCYEVCDL